MSYRVSAELSDVVDDAMRLRIHVQIGDGHPYLTEELIQLDQLLAHGAPDYLLETVLKSVSDYVRYELQGSRKRDG